tara:strand:+ start:475 stop:1035 length:561 start_codon:yes stop_codon:yes gene_type:complete
MVKNKAGGSRHKKMARKHVNNSNNVIRKIRQPREKGEMIARIVRVEGGSNFEVLCNDGKRRLLYVRQKFKGRNKRDNSLSIDTMVMIGLREWQVTCGKKREKVDLLEVYRDQYAELRKIKNINMCVFPAVEQKTDNSEDVFEIDRGQVTGDLDEKSKEELNKNINEKLEKVEEEEDEEVEIDWDAL